MKHERGFVMNITHVLSDGTVLDDITGHVVKAGENETVYNLINKINEKQYRRRKGNEQKEKEK